jgi:hypothetical protein
VDQDELRDLLREDGGGLLELGVDEAGADDVVKAVQVFRNIAATLHIERALELADHHECMIDGTGARLGVALLEGNDGAAQVFDGLLVEADDESYGARAPYGCLAV